jgi:hypothetical protein
MRQENRTIARIRAGIFVLALLGATTAETRAAAARPCDAEIKAIEKWNSDFLRVLYQTLKGDAYNAVRNPYLPKYRQRGQVLWDTKNPADCAKPMKDWCAEVNRDYSDYNVPCTY